MHLNYDFTPIFVRISSCLVCIPGRVLAECAPAPSRSLQLWLLCSLLHWQLLPEGSRIFLGMQPPRNDGRPCSYTPHGLGKSFFCVNSMPLSSVNTPRMTTDLGVNEKSRSALFCEEGEVFGGFAASSQDSAASPRSPASPGEGTWKHLGLCQLREDKPRREVQGEGSSRASKISPDAIPAHSQVKPVILPGNTALQSSAPFPGGLVAPGHGCFHV